MKLLVFTPCYPSFPGQSILKATYALHYFFRDWAKRNQVEIVVIKPIFLLRVKRISYLRKEHIDGITVYTVGCLKVLRKEHWFSFGAVKKLCRNLIDQGFVPDLLLTHMYGGLKMALAANLKKPLVFGVHNSDLNYIPEIQKRMTSIDGWAFRSFAIKQRFLSNLSVSGPRYIAASGVDREHILSKEEYLSRQFHSPIRFLFVGALRPGKNLDITIEALSRLPADCPWQFTIIGDGSEKSSLEGLVKQKQLESRIFLKGLKTHGECMEEMNQSDVFVMVSAPETFGLVYLEALSKGMVVLGAENWGIDGVIHHGKNGFLSPVRNIESLTENLREIINRKDWKEIRLAMYETIRSMTQEHQSEQYLQFLKEQIHPEMSGNEK